MVWPDKDGNDARGQGKPPAKNLNGENLMKTMQVGNPADQTTAGERLGLYKKTYDGKTEHKNYDPLNQDVRVAAENIEGDSMFDNLQGDISV